MAMTGGTSYLLVDKYTVDNDNRVRLYLYVKEKSQDTSKLTTTLQLGMYVNSTYAIGSWSDGHGSYIGTSTSGDNCKSFNGSIGYGSGTRWLVENKEVTVKHASDGTASAKIYWKWGVWAYTTYIIGYQNPSGSKTVSITPIKTKCKTPTTFTATPDNFETDVTLKWSGATSGVGNDITKYQIRYATSSNNKTWGDWTDLVTVDKDKSNYTKNVSSFVSRGYYIKFAIRALCSDSSYYSPWAYSGVVRRKPYTKCTAPTTFTASPNVFESTVELSWSGANGGTSNSISAYYIEYATSATGLTWGSWSALKTVATTKTAYTLEVNLASKIGRNSYVKFRIRTQGSAGSSYYSDYKSSSSIKRNPYGVCTAPKTITVQSEADINSIRHTDIFNNTITLFWSGAKKGENNAITGYDIDYCTSDNQTNWSDWNDLQETISATTSITTDISSKVSRGNYVKFRIRTMGQRGVTYYSSYVESTAIKRNHTPTMNPLMNKLDVISPITLEYSFGDSIELQWNKAVDYDENLKYYEISVRYTQSNAWTAWRVLTSTLSNTASNYTFTQSNTIYQSILNNQQVQFRIKAKDIFGESSSPITSDVIIRYDITGISIEKNGKWRSCQLYYLGWDKNEWIECEAQVEQNGQWTELYDGT